LKSVPLILVLLLTLRCEPFAAAQSKTVEDRLREAASLIAEDHLAQAEHELNSVLTAAPNDARVLNLLGTIRAKQGNLNGAETFFLRAALLDKDLLGAHMNLAYLYLLKHESDKQALELLEVLRIDPNNQDAAYKLASLRLQQGKPGAAIEVITKFTENNALTRPLLLVLGDAYLNKGDLNQADNRYRSALAMQATSAEALLGLAQIALLRGNGAAALEFLNRTEGLTADSPDLLYKYGMVALNAGLSDKAIAAIRRAIDIKSDEPAYRLMLGIAWIKKGDPQEAELAFRDFIKTRPADRQGQLYLGYILLKQKKNAEARQWIEESVKQDPTRAEGYYYLGLIAQDESDDEKAVLMFEKAIKLQPSLTSAHTALGASCLKLKNYVRAQQELEAAVKLNPDDSKAHYHLALLYARDGDSAAAQEQW
jgi:Flp pilus assembly protein TadD